MIDFERFNQISPLTGMDDRLKDIFRTIVESYLETGDPVGSRNISKALPISLSPASVRNVMSDLEQLGLVYSPHTSAGRLPTELGLRFFVDAMMEFGDLSNDERRIIERQMASSHAPEAGVENLLTKASQMLSGMSSGAGLVLSSKQDKRLKHVEFVRLETTKALVILVDEDDRVENRLIDLPSGLPASALTEASNFLNAHIRGKTLLAAQEEVEAHRHDLQAELDDLSAKLVEAGLATWAGASNDQPQSLIVRGRSKLLENVTAREDLERIRHLFDDLESKKDLIQLLQLADEGDGVRIYIGSENKLFSLSGSSVIVSPYRDSDRNIVGILGVIGPTRLNYARIVPMVDYTARVLSSMLSDPS
ncbi:heat-inducible transcription repressor HrcA [Cohaesibacter sp. ES.047]|uniref:heat-inducible transcriptional repressor HrcA n=1 Tax=Cohaesibacter sp. ES.047 TaxID=1798205 RepID=UPI000BB6D505|nr:heat-inducible transcriptional repressor HrcA [Cohaesibacter sp. ES.047]SNY90471.1 heat-inducible transcription repressor HrcA [Cohaesibacter sp. ES.047]